MTLKLEKIQNSNAITFDWINIVRQFFFSVFKMLNHALPFLIIILIKPQTFILTVT